MQLLRTFAHRVALVLAAGLLAGCATLSQDGGVVAVQSMVQEGLGGGVTLPAKDADEAQGGDVRRLLGQPHSPDAAERVALLNNRGLRGSLAELGISEPAS